jgi:transcriptional regulator with XRE-family HTH domain
MPELPGPNPVIHRRRLRGELRRAREAAGKSQRETADAMDWSLSKLIRIETGDVKIGTNDLRALLAYYGVTSDRIAELVEVARAAREPARWSNYRSVASPELLSYCSYESYAQVVRNFEPILVPGLLQTEEYARVVIGRARDQQLVDGLVDLRIERQELLVRNPIPDLHFIVDESVLKRTVGDKEVMRRQLIQMKELALLPNVHLRIVTFSQGIYTAMLLPYVILEFNSPEDEDVLYIESPTGEQIVREDAPAANGRKGGRNNPADYSMTGPADYLQAFWQLEQIAHQEETQNLLDEALVRLSG